MCKELLTSTQCDWVLYLCSSLEIALDCHFHFEDVNIVTQVWLDHQCMIIFIYLKL